MLLSPHNWPIENDLLILKTACGDFRFIFCCSEFTRRWNGEYVRSSNGFFLFRDQIIGLCYCLLSVCLMKDHKEIWKSIFGKHRKVENVLIRAEKIHHNCNICSKLLFKSDGKRCLSHFLLTARQQPVPAFFAKEIEFSFHLKNWNSTTFMTSTKNIATKMNWKKTKNRISFCFIIKLTVVRMIWWR